MYTGLSFPVFLLFIWYFSFCSQTSARKVLLDLEHFMEEKVPLVKFVDRTYNLDETYFLPIMHYLSMADTETTFHFEIKADLLSENTLKFLKQYQKAVFSSKLVFKAQIQKHWKPSAGK